jgi:radical SAM superfamily enzyme YgiQ (UPF0313 family)
LAYLAAALSSAGVSVSGFDARVDPLATLRKRLRAGVDVVGLSAYSTNLGATARLARLVRRWAPGARLAVGGPHATLDPGDALERTGAEAAIRGDGETPLVCWVKGEGSTPGVYTPDRDAPIHVEPALDALPLADREVFPLWRYYRTHLRRSAAWTALIATRGCTLPCAHCAAPQLSGGCHRQRSRDSILEELDLLVNAHGIQGIYLEDDNLLLDRQWALGLFDAFRRFRSRGGRAADLRLELPNGVPPARLDGALLRAMSRAGVQALALGVESLREADQRLLGRPGFGSAAGVGSHPPVGSDDRWLDHLRGVVRLARAEGIRVTGYGLLGLPGQPIGEVARDLVTWSRLGFDAVHLSRWRPVPGTHLAAAPAPGAGGLALRDLALRGVRGLFYLGFYGSPWQLRALLRREGPSAALVLKALRRYVGWLAQ